VLAFLVGFVFKSIFTLFFMEFKDLGEEIIKKLKVLDERIGILIEKENGEKFENTSSN